MAVPASSRYDIDWPAEACEVPDWQTLSSCTWPLKDGSINSELSGTSTFVKVRLDISLLRGLDLEHGSCEVPQEISDLEHGSCEVPQEMSDAQITSEQVKVKKDNAAMALWRDAGSGEKGILKDYSEERNKSSELRNLLTGYNQHGVVEKQRKHNQNGHVKVSQNHYITKDGVAVQHGSITNLSTSAGKGMSGSVSNRYTREISKEARCGPKPSLHSTMRLLTVLWCRGICAHCVWCGDHATPHAALSADANSEHPTESKVSSRTCIN